MLLHVVASGFPRAAREGKPQCANTFQAFALNHICYISLAKVSHMAMPQIHVGEAREPIFIIYHTEGLGREKRVKDNMLKL